MTIFFSLKIVSLQKYCVYVHFLQKYHTLSQYSTRINCAPLNRKKQDSSIESITDLRRVKEPRENIEKYLNYRPYKILHIRNTRFLDYRIDEARVPALDQSNNLGYRVPLQTCDFRRELCDVHVCPCTDIYASR